MRAHGEIARQMVDVQDHLMAAMRTLDRERPHAVLAHIREVHPLDRAVREHRCQRFTPGNENDPRKSEGQSQRGMMLVPHFDANL
jgi:hypothetical protein